MRALVTGVSGLLGSYLIRTADPSDDLCGTYFHHFMGIGRKATVARMDIDDPKEIEKIFAYFQPEVVIHCAGEGRAWKAEEDPVSAHRLNVTGTMNIIAECAKIKAHLVYISTNAVYDGQNPPYNEESELHPVNAYGRIKARAEGLIREYLFKRTIIRPIQLYGWPPVGARENMASLIVKQLRQGEQVKVATDLIVQPTYAEDCARAIWYEIKGTGLEENILNIAGPEIVSLYRFAEEVCLQFGLDASLLKKAENKDLTTPRPLNTCFDTNKLSNHPFRLLNMHDGLILMKASENAI